MLDYRWKDLLEKLKKQPFDMPRIVDGVLNCILYLYPDEDAARQSRKAGGSGFMFGVHSEVDNSFVYSYAVTNRHVIEGGGNPNTVMRVNLNGGGVDVVKKQISDWVFHPDDEDLAVCYIENDIDITKHTAICWAAEASATDEILDKQNIGIGDDVFIVGRFQSVGGKLQNTPTVRYGNIAQMPIEPIENPLGVERKAYVVECHSISGFSGSPVFVYLDHMASRPAKNFSFMGSSLILIGVDMGHIPIMEHVYYEQNGKWEKDGAMVKANSAMMTVAPIQKIWDILNTEDFVMKRKEHDKKLKAQKKQDLERIVPDSLPDISEEDFKSALKKTARKINPDEPDQSKPRT